MARGWVGLNPCRSIRKPVQPKHRERVLSWGEIRAMLRVMGWRTDAPVRMMGQAVAGCMLLAMRTVRRRVPAEFPVRCRSG